MASRAIRIKASKNPDVFLRLPIDGEFRKRDVEVLREDQSLWTYLTRASADALKEVDFDDDANVAVYVWKSDVREFLEDFQSDREA